MIRRAATALLLCVMTCATAWAQTTQSVNYIDEKGQSKTYDCGGTVFQNDPLRVDTIVLAKGFHFPACNYGQVNTKISLKLTCSILARESSRFAREMYLDCIYLRPSKKEE